MVPNLFVATRTLVTPHRWFKSKPDRDARKKASLRKTEHWEEPVPGVYEYIPGRGWYLIRTDASIDDPKQPEQVTYSKVLKRYIFKTEYDDRKRQAVVKLHEIPSRSGSVRTVATEEGKPAPPPDIKAPLQPGRKGTVGSIPQTRTVIKESGFFRLDDGVAWVRCWDEAGDFIPGPYERWCVDKKTGGFRKMLKGDDPEWQNRRSSRATHYALQAALSGTTATSSGGASPLNSGSLPTSAAQSRVQSACPSPRSSIQIPRQDSDRSHAAHHAVSVFDLPSRASTRPPSPASHHYKTPMEGPTSPTLSEKLKEIAESKA